MMIRIGVIGVGNAARGDDAVGLVVARRLLPMVSEGVTVVEARGDGAGLLEMWQGSDAVILIDASVSGAEPGTIHRLEPLTQPIPCGWFPCSTHAFGVTEAIALGRALQQLPPRMVIYGIEGKQFDLGKALSAEVGQAVPDVVQRVQQDIGVLQTQRTGD
jgi:hydrogenase maturation protease